MKGPDRLAHEALDAAFLAVLRRRDPRVVWRLVRPDEGLERNAATWTREVVGRLPVPQDERALVDGQLLPASKEDGINEAT